MLGVDLDLELENMTTAGVSNLAKKIRISCREKGYVVRPTYGGKTFNFLPMYISSEDQIVGLIRSFVNVAEEMINELRDASR